MALSGIQIYKMLPKTNCKDCGFPTCLAFAMKLGAKQVELSACPHVSDEAKSQLAEASQPPVRLVSLKSNGHEVKAGNEVVLFRHEKTFYHKPGLFVRVTDDMSAEDIKAKVAAADAYMVDYVGMELTIDGFGVKSIVGDAASFAAAVKAVREASQRPLILSSSDPAVIEAGLAVLNGENPMVYGANGDNWEAMADLAKANNASLGIMGESLDALADLTEKVVAKGVEDIVLDPMARDLGASLTLSTQIRRLAIKKNYRPLGYPIISLAYAAEEKSHEMVLAAQAIAKYAGFVVIDNFSPDTVYPLLVLRENIYTDPQKPIQVKPGLYEINNPTSASPVLVTTNFSITYFSVANEVEGSGMAAWLLVADAEGMSVLTAWAAGKFDAERIAKAVKEHDVANKIDTKRIVLPGAVAVLSGELEEELPDWDVRVGPREAVDLPPFMKNVL